MRQNPSFIKVALSENTYLMPVGQSVSDLKRTIRLNDTGAYLWDLLAKDQALEYLVETCASHFLVPQEQIADYRRDITAFLNTLSLQGMLLSEIPVPKGSSDYYHTLSIAGLSINLYGEDDVFAEEFAPFYRGYQETADMSVLVLYGAPAAHENGQLIIRNRELTLSELSRKYILLFHRDSHVRELHLSKDGSLAIFYCIPGDTLKEDLFHAMRFAFLYLAQRNDILALHSASILYREKAWLFSAPSGTGKSTHTALWHTLLGTPYINGDLNLLALRDGQAYVYGLPWCGTSGICDTGNYPLGGVIFLKQASKDTIIHLTGDDRILALSRRLISPSWDGEMLKKQLSICNDISRQIFMCRLLCTKERSALDAVRPYIDHFIST